MGQMERICGAGMGSIIIWYGILSLTNPLMDVAQFCCRKEGDLLNSTQCGGTHEWAWETRKRDSPLEFELSGKGAALPPLPPLSSSLCCQRIFHQIIHSEIKRSFQSSESAPKSRASVDLACADFHRRQF